MTRRRPGGAVRVLSSCSRCNAHLSHGLGRREVAFLPVDGHCVRHELAVCRECDAHHARDLTLMEAAALARDASIAVEAMEFAQQWGHELARVQRTARYFVGELRASAAAVALREEYLARRDQHDALYETYRQRVAERDFVPDAEPYDDDDLPF